MSSRFGRLVFTAAALAAAASLAAASPAAAAAANLTPQEKALIRAAKKEGAVTVINPIFSDITAQRMGPAFIKRYGLGSNFQFNNLRKGTGATVAQVRQEIRAGKFTVDVHIVSAPGFFEVAAKHGAFLKLNSGYWKKDFTAMIKRAHQFSLYPYVVTPFAYTFQPVWNSSCPGMADVNITDYADALSPKLKGKVIASDLTKSFTYTNTAISLSQNGIKLPDLWKRLKALDPIVEFRTEVKMQSVISCERPLDMWNLSGRVYQNVLKKPGLAKFIKIGSYKEGQVMLGNQMAVLKGAPHPNAGKLFAEFMLSKPGTDVYVEGEALYSFRKGYKPPKAAAPYLLDLDKVKLLGLKNWVAAQKQFKAVRAEWSKFFK